MTYAKIGKLAANYGDDLFKRATQQRTLREGVKNSFGKSRFHVTTEMINGKEEIVTYCRNTDGTINRWYANSRELYGQDGLIKTGEYFRDGKGSALFEYKPNRSIDCNYTIRDINGDTFGGIVMSQGAGGRHIEELNLGGKRITTNNGGLGHFFDMFIKDIFGG